MNEKRLYLKVKDHAFSGEEFQLLYDDEIELLETYPQPEENRLQEYYKSEDYISHTDSSRNLLEKVYHLVKHYSLKRKIKLLNLFSKYGKNLLDVGCGTGDFLKLAQINNWTITGIEPNEKARKIANIKTCYKVFDAAHLTDLKSNSFDVISLWHVLEHVPNAADHLSIFKKLLKPNGILIIATPNYKSFDASYYGSFWAAYDVPRHLWHFSKSSMSRLVERHGLKVTKTIPMLFDSYYVSLLSEKHKTGKWNPIRAFWIGTQSNLRAKSNGEYSSMIYIIENK